MRSSTRGVSATVSSSWWMGCTAGLRSGPVRLERARHRATAVRSDGRPALLGEGAGSGGNGEDGRAEEPAGDAAIHGGGSGAVRHDPVSLADRATRMGGERPLDDAGVTSAMPATSPRRARGRRPRAGKPHRHRDDGHPGGTRRASRCSSPRPHTPRRLDAEPPRSLEVDVGRGLAASDLLAGDPRADDLVEPGLLQHEPDHGRVRGRRQPERPPRSRARRTASTAPGNSGSSRR